jgi:hypothetical protein
MSEPQKDKMDPSLLESLLKLFGILFIILPITLKLLSVAFRGTLGKIMLWTIILLFVGSTLKMCIKTSHLFN